MNIRESFTKLEMRLNAAIKNNADPKTISELATAYSAIALALEQKGNTIERERSRRYTITPMYE